MNYVLNLVLLVLGFVCLVKGADWFVDGSSSLAKKLKIPAVIIGLTIVSIGTSLPEASVSITAALNEEYRLSIANVIGSNIFNLLGVVGAAALICPFVVDRMIMKRDFPISIAITGVLMFMLRDAKLSRPEAGILFAMFVAYIIILVISALKSRTQSDENYEILPLWKSLLFIVVGGAAIILGGTLTVDSATFFASRLGMGDMLVGLTIVAVGTSLPELVTSVVAAKKGESEIALGNVVGSNIFNILFILGASGLVHPLECKGMEAFIDSLILIASSVGMWILCFTGKKINRIEGIIAILVYVIYVVYICLRAYDIAPFAL